MRSAYSEIIDGRPVEYIGASISNGLITDLPEDKQEKVFEWIKSKMIPRKTGNLKHSSYGLKHILEKDTGIYVSNNQFKDAMLQAGFKPVNPYELNWCFFISEKPFLNY